MPASARLRLLRGHLQPLPGPGPAPAAPAEAAAAAPIPAPLTKPRLIHYNDARHYSLYRYDPPMSMHQLQRPIDEILGTSVDMLSYGLASGSTFLHGSERFRRWGEGVEPHNHGVMWWRAAKNLEEALARGMDPLAIVVARGREKGIKVICSLRMNDATGPADSNRYMVNPLKDEKPELMIGGDDPAVAGCLDFAHAEVRQERLDVIEEVCGTYGADGIELDPYVGKYFAESSAENTAVFTEFVRDIRALLDRIGEARGSRLYLAARIFPSEEENLAVGMDVLAWCALGIADVLIVHGGSSGFLMQQEVDVRWVSEAAFSSPNEHCWVYVSVGGVPCESHSHSATLRSLRGFLRVA